MNVEVNYLAVFLAALSSFVVGFFWYSRGVFGESWMRMVGMTDKKSQQGMAKAMGYSLVTALLTAYVIAYVAYLTNAFFTENSFMVNSVTTAFWLWLGVSATTIITHDAFEQRQMKLTVINVGNQLATMFVMGIIIGWFGI